MYKFISWSVVILWMLLIFSLSSQEAAQSNNLSKGVTRIVIETLEKVEPENQYTISNLNHLFRKNAHFFVYLVLGILAMNALVGSVKRRWQAAKWTLLICVTYAVTDEFHQIFVPGRGAQVRDVFIDSVGAGVGCGIYLLFAFGMKYIETEKR